MKIKTSELTGAALDWAVAKCEGMPPLVSGTMVVFFGEEPKALHEYTPSTDWSQGGPIMERERICITYPRWDGQATALKIVEEFEDRWEMHGPTPLIAAMRAYVASKMGAEVEVPDGLV